jgi:hypothetical protein
LQIENLGTGIFVQWLELEVVVPIGVIRWFNFLERIQWEVVIRQEALHHALSLSSVHVDCR